MFFFREPHHVAVLPLLVEATVVLTGFIHLASVLVDLAQEVKAADIGYGPEYVLGGTFHDALEPFG